MDNIAQALAGAQFEEITITLAGVGVTHPGKELANTGLGYWIAEADDNEPAFYAPTHIPSGYRASADLFYSEERCQKYIEALAPLMNWNQPFDALTSDPAYQPEKFAEINQKFHFEDMAETAAGGQW